MVRSHFMLLITLRLENLSQHYINDLDLSMKDLRLTAQGTLNARICHTITNSSSQISHQKHGAASATYLAAPRASTAMPPHGKMASS
jgi:hypothetical protein